MKTKRKVGETHPKTLPAETLERRLLFSAITVNTYADQIDAKGSTTVSLRDAIATATATSGSDTINVPQGTYNLSLGELLINDSGGTVNINGIGGMAIFKQKATHARVLEVDAKSTVSFNEVEFTGGNFPGPTENDPLAMSEGAGILSAGSVTLSNSLVTGNVLVDNADGGGIVSSGTLIIINSSVSGNSAGTIYSASGRGGGGIINTGTMTVTNSAINNNSASNEGQAEQAGGIQNGGIMTLTNDSISGNFADSDAGILNTGTATIVACTITGNNSTGAGGGIENDNKMTVTNSTISDNNSGASGAGGDQPYLGQGGGILGGSTLYGCTVVGNSCVNNDDSRGAGLSGSFVLSNTVIAGNVDYDINTDQKSGEDDVSGSVTSQGHNFIADTAGSTGWTSTDQQGTAVSPLDPKLGNLANNGGPTETQLPLTGSPLIDAGSNALIPSGITTDQRGLPRISGQSVDIGAVEVQVGNVSGMVKSAINTPIVGEKVYLDANNNSILDGGELSTTTNSSGAYIFSDVPVGAYIVRQVLQAGYAQTSPADGYGNHITITSNGSLTNQNFVDTAPVTAGGVSGIVTAGSTGVSGETIYLDANNNSVLDGSELSTKTSAMGTYSFSNVPAGAYIVRQVLLSGYSQISPSMGYGNHVTVTNNGSITNQNFADKAPVTGGSISGTVMAGNAGVGGETIYLDVNNNSKLDAGELYATTSTTGTYSFSNVPAGAYIVRQVLASGYNQTSPASGYGIHLTVTTGSTFTAQNFVDTAPTPMKLTGAIIGTAGSYRNHGTTIANAFDGNFTTFFDGPDSSGDWVGLDLGISKIVTQVKYAPRSGYEDRLVGGEIQASSSANFSSGVVTLVTTKSQPVSGQLTTQSFTNTTAYRYYRYLGPANSYCDISELEFDG